MRILVVEDSDILRENLSLGLRKSGYAVDAAAEGKDALWHAESSAYDVIVLDIMLPGLDGVSLLQRLRAQGVDTPVLFLTARDTVADRVHGLRAGADDYLVKPFAFDELLARIEALARRRYGAAERVRRCGELVIDLAAKTVTRAGRPLTLRAREFALLELLALRAGEVVGRAEIERCIYDAHVEPMSNVVESAIYALRRAIDAPGRPSYIQTRRGLGYVFADPAAGAG
jgi:DNA-binding response OmpR family regulator